MIQAVRLILRQSLSQGKHSYRLLLSRNSTISLSSLSTDSMELTQVSARLTQFAPPSLAGSWDNTGLLLEPSPPHLVSRIILTNDLTEPVMEEALEKKANMILSYHPPIFVPLKRVTQSSWKERLVIRCLENRVAVYSPHTSCDALRGGVNDWLLQPFDGTSEPIERASCGGPPFKAQILVAKEKVADISKAVNKLSGVKVTAQYSLEGNLIQVAARCNVPGLNKMVDYVQTVEGLAQTLEVSRLEKAPSADQGPGRLMKLSTPSTPTEVVAKVKQHLKLQHVRLALGVGVTMDSAVKKIAVCAGSGSSILAGVSADMYLTGEMSHHEVLDANHKGRTVILCDHSNTERGYLAERLQGELAELFENKVDIIMSERDSDPLSIV